MKKGWICRGNPCRGKVLHPAWKWPGFVGEVLARERKYIQHEKWLDMLMKTYMDDRPTNSMKKGWLCRTSYDEKNWEIAPFARDSGSNDDPALMMIQWWWFGFDDDPYWMNDPVMKTCADELCQENTFLVKRECWRIFNFGMYSLVYFIYYISLVPDVPIGRVINVIKSCKVIYINTPL